MLSFLFEQYGYYPKDFNDGIFTIGEWVFKLIEVTLDELKLDRIENYCEIIRKNFNGKGPYIINTRYNKKISLYDNKKFVLLSIKKSGVSFSDLNKFHVLFNNYEETLDLRNLLKAWQVRNADIESTAVSSLRVDGSYYSDNIRIAMFCLGLCQNAMQYLNEVILDYGYELKNLTITHKRIHYLDSQNFFDPFNFIIDHPIRDLAELYKNDFVDFGELVSLFEYYKLDSKLASLFIARIMYPVNIMDLLENNVEIKDKNLRLSYPIEKEINKIKNVYLYFKEKYNIRPINWLEVN